MPMKRPWEKKVSLKAFQKKNSLPEPPGVYFFLGASDEVLYIGKATSLRDRVKSYFMQDILATRGPKISLMLERVVQVAYRHTDSVLEALLLESELIKDHQPPYNTDAKDDKSYYRVIITKEKFPRVLMVRERDLDQGKFMLPVKYAFGPFPNGGSLRDALKIIRKLFPFRDKCVPYAELTEKQKTKARPCFSAQIGLCPGVCSGVLTASAYARNINHIRLFFQGKKNMIVRELTRDMAKAAKELRFEEANEIKRTLFGLQHIQDMVLVKNDMEEEERHRIEAFDVAHLQGDQSVGVMTVVQNSHSRNENYRQFKLRGKHGGNDLTALEEILRRRFAHPEWPFPEIVVVDGGKAQLHVAERVLEELGISIPVLGVVKNERHRPERLIGPEALAERFKKEALLANAEAHRFAITFHRKRRRGAFLR